jgi:fumarylacetoacetase
MSLKKSKNSIPEKDLSKAKSWIEVPTKSDFPIQNLPFGIFKTETLKPRTGVAIGDYVLDLAELKKTGVFNHLKFDTTVFTRPYLNDFISLGKKTTSAVRSKIFDLLEENNPELRNNKNLHKKVLLNKSEVQMLMPVKVGDYTDFYSSMEHATNVGSMFRDPKNALLPNWKHLPVAYHGRASSIILSGTDIHRPKGQFKTPDSEVPEFGFTRQLDFELEMAFITHQGKPLGQSISTNEAENYIFGMVLFNDWSARDIQAWEYVPLGPFLAKNFASSISPWIVTLDALKPFYTKGPEQTPKVLPYLEFKGEKNIDINLEVFIKPDTSQETKICTSNYKYLYWNMSQQLAHHTINGCNINAGDMMASGTISGPDQSSFGSMLELTWRGTKPLKMADNSERKFIDDNDTVIMRGYCEKNGLKIGFGEVRTKVLPAL